MPGGVGCVVRRFIVVESDAEIAGTLLTFGALVFAGNVGITYVFSASRGIQRYASFAQWEQYRACPLNDLNGGCVWFVASGSIQTAVFVPIAISQFMMIAASAVPGVKSFVVPSVEAVLATVSLGRPLQLGGRDCRQCSSNTESSLELLCKLDHRAILNEQGS